MSSRVRFFFVWNAKNLINFLSFLCSRKSVSVSSSLSDLVGSSLDLSDFAADTMLTIEDLRAQMGSCFTCGVSWSDDHVSLDCSECGGYSLSRPCPLCEGACGQQWKRDFTQSHASNKARWVGVCPKLQPNVLVQTTPSTVVATTHHHQSRSSSSVNNQFLAQELCARLEQLSHSWFSESIQETFFSKFNS